MPSNKAVTYPVLDSLRFLGAFAIVVTHVSFQTGQYGPGLFGTLVARLDVGVAIFFVLSGFLLSRPYFSKMAQRSDLPAVNFYLWKRFLRIMPVYIVTVIAVLTLMPEARGHFHPRWTSNLSMTTIYGSDALPAGLTQMWSLATEVAFYLALPLLMSAISLVMCRRAWRPTGILVMLIAICCLNFTWLAMIDLSSNRALWLPAFLSWFCAGMAVSVSSVEVDRHASAGWTRLVAQLGASPGACYLTAGTLLLIASTPLAGPIFGAVPTATESISKNLLYLAIGFFIVIPGVFSPAERRSSQFLSTPPLRYLGTISYGVFCTHLLVLYFVFRLLGYEYFDGHFIEVFILTMIGTVVLSALIYRYVERPLNGFRQIFRPKTEAAIDPNAHAIAS